MIYYAVCNECDTRSPDFVAGDLRDNWLDYHWELTGHDTTLSFDDPHEHVHILGLCQARYPSTCVTCGKHSPKGAHIAPNGFGWDCHSCAYHRAKETA